MLGAESAVLILDDTPGMWPQHKRNLIQVELTGVEQPLPH